MMTFLKTGDTLTIKVLNEKTMGTIEVVSTTANQVIGKLRLDPGDDTQEPMSLFRAANDAADAFSFAAMELEEHNLAAISTNFVLADGSVLRLGTEAFGLLIAENCTHIAFKVTEGSLTEYE